MSLDDIGPRIGPKIAPALSSATFQRVKLLLERQRPIWRILPFLAVAVLPLPAAADEVEQAFDHLLGAPTAPASPQAPVYPQAPASPQTSPWAAPPVYPSPLQAHVAELAEPHLGRIGVAAFDLTSGREVAVLGDQPFPLASTSKVAIAATFLDGVDAGRYRIDGLYPLMIPLPSRKFSTLSAPERPGAMKSAQELIELAITRSDNAAADALLAAVGGPQAVNRWLRKAGISGMRMDRTIGTLVRDDGAVNPATTIDVRDSTTPQAMVQLLTGLWRGQWLSPTSRDVLFGAMSRCQTGLRRMRAALPDVALIGHKTGTLSNTSSDVGFIRTPDGHTLAVAIYVTGQGNKPGREARIASITRAIYDGYPASDMNSPRTAAR